MQCAYSALLYRRGSVLIAQGLRICRWAHAPTFALEDTLVSTAHPQGRPSASPCGLLWPANPQEPGSAVPASNMPAIPGHARHIPKHAVHTEGGPAALCFPGSGPRALHFLLFGNPPASWKGTPASFSRPQNKHHFLQSLVLTQHLKTTLFLIRWCCLCTEARLAENKCRADACLPVCRTGVSGP